MMFLQKTKISALFGSWFVGSLWVFLASFIFQHPFGFMASITFIREIPSVPWEPSLWRRGAPVVPQAAQQNSAGGAEGANPRRIPVKAKVTPASQVRNQGPRRLGKKKPCDQAKARTRSLSCAKRPRMWTVNSISSSKDL